MERIFTNDWLILHLEELSHSYGNSESALGKELLSEWLDVVQTEMFVGCLYELLTKSVDALLEKVEEILLEDPAHLA
jgi:hypothetical protein